MRSTTRLLIFVAGFCACFMAFWLSSDFTARRAPGSRELARDEATTDTERQMVEGIPKPATIQTAGRTSPDGVSTAAELEGGPHWSLFVIDDATREPVAGASVYFFSPRRIAQVLLIDDPSVFFALAEFYERYGLQRTTNELGMAEIPQANAPFWVVAMAPSRFGGATLDPTQATYGEFELALQPSEFLEARVLSASDRKPLSGVAVALRDEGLMGFPIGAKSDAQGLARLGPFSSRTNDEPARFVTVHGVFSRPVEAWARAGYAPMAELLVPDSERLLVRIVDSLGKVCAIDGELALDWNGRPKSMAQWVKLPIRAGTVAIPRVELGMKLSLRAELNGAGAQPVVEFTMPSVAHDQRFDLSIDPKISIVRVKLLRGGQQAIGPAAWQVGIACTCSPVRALEGDCNGALRASETISFALGALPEGQCAARFAIQVRSVSGGDLGGLFKATVHGGVNDLGTWLLEPASVLCSGRVVDSRGFELPLRVVEVDALPRSSPVTVLALEATSGPDGRFELRGWADAKAFSLSVRDRHGAFARTQASTGQTDISIIVDDD